MKILISADMEGVTGLSNIRQTSPKFPDAYAQGCDLMVHDINAAIRGLRSTGSVEIDLLDLHGNSGNIITDKLEPRINLLGGFIELINMMRKDELHGRYDGWIQLGMHSKAGTRDGFLNHTNGTCLADVRINGNSVGEIQLIAWLAGHYDIPTLLVAGDDTAVREADSSLPGIKTVTVKNSQAQMNADCLSLVQTAALIEAAAADAMKNLSQAKVFKTLDPVQVEVEFANPELAKSAHWIPGADLINKVTIGYKAENITEGLCFIHASRLHAQRKWNGPLMNRILSIEEAGKAAGEYYEEWGMDFMTQPPPFPTITYKEIKA